jgi:hypothetical protein
MTTHPLALIGNGLAVLVAATERARRGLPTLVVNPGGPWGGYFAGVHADGVRWDAGMVLYEFDSYRMPASAPALASYAPQRRNDIGRFCATVRDYVARHQQTRPIAPPSMWVDARVQPDLLLANRVEALPQLVCAEAARRELALALDARLASPLHARRKDGWAHHAPDADAASRLNHGRVLHEAVFAPFAHQVLNRDASHLAALYHRVPWLPLYWPETLLAALDGRATLPPSTFWHPTGAGVADLCRTLAEALEASPHIALRAGGVRIAADRHGFALHLVTAPHEVLRAGRLAWAGTSRQALDACGLAAREPAIEARLPLLLALLRVPRAALRRDFSVLHLVAADTGCYRIGHVSALRGDDNSGDVRLVVEANADRFAIHHGRPDDDAATLDAVMRDLAATGVLAEGTRARFSRLLRVPSGLPLPTPAALAAWQADDARLRDALPALHRLAASAAPFATSLSDQIVQGLALAEID